MTALSDKRMGLQGEIGQKRKQNDRKGWSTKYQNKHRN